MLYSFKEKMPLKDYSFNHCWLLYLPNDLLLRSNNQMISFKDLIQNDFRIHTYGLTTLLEIYFDFFSWNLAWIENNTWFKFVK